MEFSCIPNDSQARSEEASVFPSLNVYNMGLQGASLIGMTPLIALIAGKTSSSQVTTSPSPKSSLSYM